MTEKPNFHKISSGSIKDGILYRSSSPLKGGDNKKILEALAIKAGIKCVINLDDITSVINDLSKDVPWYNELVKKGNVICLHMTYTIPGIKSNEKKLRDALQFMIDHEGPYLIHCFAGVDRTGFFSALLEGLMGTSLDEICKNYLSAFNFDSSILSQFDEYSKITNFLKQLKKMCHGQNIVKINISSAIEEYLVKDVGLSEDEVFRLKGVLKTPTLS